MKLLHLFFIAFAIFQTPKLIAAEPASEQRLDIVANKGRHVMPFSLEKTLHIFSKTKKGGLQQVVAKNPSDSVQISLIQQHLDKIHQDFMKGDFSDPQKIHGEKMPGLKTLKNAKPGDIGLQFRLLSDGAQINYTAEKPHLINAIHQWFDAQLSDHARHAVTHKTHHRMHKD